MKIETNKSRAQKEPRPLTTREVERLKEMTGQWLIGQCQNCGKVHPSLDDLAYCDCRR